MNDFAILSNGSLGRSSLPTRPEDSHKGTFGKLLLVCGSRDMAGAAYFAAKSAYRMGAGLCRILTVRENLPILATLLPEALLTGYDADAPDPDTVAAAEEWADALVIGCGIGTSLPVQRILSFLLRTTKKPTVLDADALNLLSAHPSLFSHAKGAILTPHAMEMARLVDKDVSEITSDPTRIAHDFAKRHGVICVLKGHRSVITDGGDTVYRNETGNSGMATGGSGDVLAGMIGGLLAGALHEGADPLTLSRLAVHLHGLCGEAASMRLTEYSVMASDLIDEIPTVLRRFISDQ